MPIKNMTPLLQVYDMKTSVAFYCDILNFKVAHAYKPDGHFYWASLEQGDIKLMLNACYEDDKRPAEPDANRVKAHRDTELYLECDNIDAVYTSLKEKGIDLKPPSQSVYGAMEIKLHDPDGFQIIFFQKETQSQKAKNPMVIHYVHDMDRAKTFYKKTFNVPTNFESPGWTTLNFGAIELALHILDPNTTECDAPLPHAGLNLEVDSIEEIQADIENLGGRLIELREPHGGVPVRVATCQDSEGNGFELRQHP